MKGISILKKKEKSRSVDKPDYKTVNGFEKISLDQIKKGTPFINLFPINPETLKSITADMKENGFDKSQPVIIWKETNVLIDGHTRSEAAKKAGLDFVYAIYESFPDVDAALKYAYGLQFKRRNLTDADRFQFAETYLNNVGHGTNKSGWKKKELSEVLSVSVGTAQKYISVISRGSDKTKESVRTGIITINRAYNSLLVKEKDQSADKVEEPKKANKNRCDLKVVRGGESSKTIEIDEEFLMKKLEEWGSETDVEMGNFFPFKERLLAIYEVIPDSSHLKEFTKELLERGVNDERIRHGE